MKAQMSVEFIFLFTIVFFIFLVVIGFADRYMADSNDTAERNKLDIIGDSLKKELILAKESGTEFESSFKLQKSIDGADYIINVDAADTLYLKHGAKDVAVTKLIPNLTQWTGLNPGDCYKILKNTTGDIKIENYACP